MAAAETANHGKAPGACDTGMAVRIKLQVFCGTEIAMGPGKADLLDAIEREGSISGAARVLGMSYRRAWLLVDTMNRCWREALVTTAPGGAARGGGARLTPIGIRVRESYRALQRQAARAAGASPWDELSAALLDQPLTRQGQSDRS